MNFMLHRLTNREERAYHVAQMRANFAIEGMSPQADDLELQQSYIDGQIGIDEMLQYARDCAAQLAAR
jgi:hypothetical protein